MNYYFYLISKSQLQRPKRLKDNGTTKETSILTGKVIEPE